jgi:hypothetical protein
LGVDAGVALQFSEVGGEVFPTVRVTVGTEATPHAVLGAGERFEFSAGGNEYLLSVLSVDSAAKRARLRVDRLEASGPAGPP